MLSCLLNGERINCCDGQHSKEQLKKWASKKILMCPACGKPYEYCHGKVKTPYFRHMDKDQCEDRFSEPETEEHLKGKMDLYEWLKKQPGVTNCILEGWLATTKQRPDIMFKYNGQQCVLEYQCSPISSEYYERHELYKAAGIKDFWVLGINKYFTNTSRKKHIQNIAIGHYSPFDKNLIIYEYTYFYQWLKNKNNKLCLTSYGNYNTGKYFGRNINNYTFSTFKIVDMCFDTLDNIQEKIRYREQNKPKHLRLKDAYLYMQKDINKENLSNLEEYISNKLLELNNDNWHFSLKYTKSRYKVFCYICAVPIVNLKFQNYVYEKELKKINRDFFQKIKVWKLDSEKIYKNDDYLKELLINIMKHNKNILLSWNFKDFRILE